MAKRRRPKRSAEPPTASCLLICDEVQYGFARDKHILVGVVNGILVPRLPAVIGPYAAYVRMSNVYSNQKTILSFGSAATDEEVFRFEAQAPAKADPLGTHVIILKIPAFEIREGGRYIFSALHDGVPFAQSLINIDVASIQDAP